MAHLRLALGFGGARSRSALDTGISSMSVMPGGLAALMRLVTFLNFLGQLLEEALTLCAHLCRKADGSSESP